MWLNIVYALVVVLDYFANIMMLVHWQKQYNIQHKTPSKSHLKWANKYAIISCIISVVCVGFHVIFNAKDVFKLDVANFIKNNSNESFYKGMIYMSCINIANTIVFLLFAIATKFILLQRLLDVYSLIVFAMIVKFAVVAFALLEVFPSSVPSTS